jgi:hypothetical protein
MQPKGFRLPQSRALRNRWWPAPASKKWRLAKILRSYAIDSLVMLSLARELDRCEGNSDPPQGETGGPTVSAESASDGGIFDLAMGAHEFLCTSRPQNESHQFS